MATHYETLGVSPTDSPEDIKKTYRQMMRTFHEDANGGESIGDVAKEINAAYSVLGNTERRAAYDRELRDEAAAKAAPPRQEQARPQYQSAEPAPPQRQPEPVREQTPDPEVDEQFQRPNLLPSAALAALTSATFVTGAFLLFQLSGTVGTSTEPQTGSAGAIFLLFLLIASVVYWIKGTTVPALVLAAVPVLLVALAFSDLQVGTLTGAEDERFLPSIFLGVGALGAFALRFSTPLFFDKLFAVSRAKSWVAFLRKNARHTVVIPEQLRWIVGNDADVTGYNPRTQEREQWNVRSNPRISNSLPALAINRSGVVEDRITRKAYEAWAATRIVTGSEPESVVK